MKQSKQEVLCPDKGMSQRAGLGHSKLEDLLGPRCIGKVGPDVSGPLVFQRTFHAALEFVYINVHISEDGSTDGTALTKEPKEQVFCPDVLVVDA